MKISRFRGRGRGREIKMPGKTIFSVNREIKMHEKNLFFDFVGKTQKILSYRQKDTEDDDDDEVFKPERNFLDAFE